MTGWGAMGMSETTRGGIAMDAVMDERYILLVEDNEDDEELTIRALRKNHIGNKVVVARDGAEALERIFGPPGGQEEIRLPTLTLLDLRLPRISGLEVLRRIRDDPRTKRAPVVILTASKEESDVLAGYELGANAYVRKPVSFSEFAEAVRVLGLFWLILNEAPPTFRPVEGHEAAGSRVP